MAAKQVLVFTWYSFTNDDGSEKHGDEDTVCELGIAGIGFNGSKLSFSDIYVYIHPWHRLPSNKIFRLQPGGEDTDRGNGACGPISSKEHEGRKLK